MAIDEYSDAVTREVESRLDDLFGEFESVQAQQEPFETEATTPDNAPSPLNEDVPPDHTPAPNLNDPIDQLKATFYSLDWEITEESMHTFFGQIMDLKKAYKDEPVIYQNLRLLGAVGKYIRRNKADAHPDSFGLFKSLFDCFENAVSKTSDKTENKRKLKQEVVKFKTLRQEILKLSGKNDRIIPKADVEIAEPIEAVVEDVVDESVVEMHDESVPLETPQTLSAEAGMPGLEATVENIKEFIKAELLKLKDEIVQQVLAQRSGK